MEQNRAQPLNTIPKRAKTGSFFVCTIHASRRHVQEFLTCVLALDSGLLQEGSTTSANAKG